MLGVTDLFLTLLLLTIAEDIDFGAQVYLTKLYREPFASNVLSMTKSARFWINIFHTASRLRIKFTRFYGSKMNFDIPCLLDNINTVKGGCVYSRRARKIIGLTYLN